MINYTPDKVKDNLNYFMNLKSAMGKHELTVKSLHLRRNLLERQRIANYTNDQTKLSLIERARQLKALGAEATSGIQFKKQQYSIFICAEQYM